MKTSLGTQRKSTSPQVGSLDRKASGPKDSCLNVADLSSRREISEAKESLDRSGRRSQTKRAGRKRKKELEKRRRGVQSISPQEEISRDWRDPKSNWNFSNKKSLETSFRKVPRLVSDFSYSQRSPREGSWIELRILPLSFSLLLTSHPHLHLSSFSFSCQDSLMLLISL